MQNISITHLSSTTALSAASDNMLLRLDYLEARHGLAGMSVGQHQLLAYLKSLRAVMHVQFTKKGLCGGKSEVVRLAEESKLVQVSRGPSIQLSC